MRGNLRHDGVQTIHKRNRKLQPPASILRPLQFKVTDAEHQSKGLSSVPLIGYIHPHENGELPFSHTQELKSAGCEQVHNEGGNRPIARRVLKKVIGEIRKDDTLVVVHVDQLANSLSRLNRIYDIIKAKGAALCALQGQSSEIPFTNKADLQKKRTAAVAAKPETCARRKKPRNVHALRMMPRTAPMAVSISVR